MSNSKRIQLDETSFYLCAFVPVVFCSFYDTTTFKVLFDISTVYMCVRVYMLELIVIKCIYIDQYKLKELAIIATIVLLGAFSTIMSQRAALFEYIILLIGAYKVDPKRIAKAYLAVAVPFIVCALIASKAGLIIDYTITRRESELVRHSFGIVYTTDFAAHIFYIVLAWLYVKREKMNIRDLIIIMIVIYFIDRNCNARLAEGMLLISGILFYIYDHKSRFFESKLFYRIVQISGFAFTVIVFALAHLYDISNPLMVYIDETFFNGRFYIAKRVIGMYGLSLFGQKITMQGDGYKTYVYDTNLGTTYIDSAYLQIGLLYGFVFLLIILIAISIYSKRCYLSGNTRLLLVIFLVLCSCLHNQYLVLIAYNPFMVMMGGYIFYKEAEINEQTIGDLHKWKQKEKIHW